jgi:dienelactone hydrolase
VSLTHRTRLRRRSSTPRWVVATTVAILGSLAVSACSGASSATTPPVGQASSTAETTEVVSVVATTNDAPVAATTAAPTTTAAAPGGTVAASPPNPERIELTDTSRSTVRDGQVIANHRYLPTFVWRPSRPGRFPLVVFAHGYRLGPMGYSRFCAALAEAGYVVAAPSFPLADESRANGLDRADIPNEAVDVGFVIAALRAGSVASSLTADAVGVVGHSDGADVALLVGERVGLTVPGIGAIVSISPDALYDDVVGAPPPLLLMHGDADSVVPYSESVQVFSHVHGARYFLTLTGADHLPPIAGGTSWTPTLDEAVASFLDAELKHVGADPGSALGALPNSQLQVAG